MRTAGGGAVGGQLGVFGGSAAVEAVDVGEAGAHHRALERGAVGELDPSQRAAVLVDAVAAWFDREADPLARRQEASCERGCFGPAALNRRSGLDRLGRVDRVRANCQVAPVNEGVERVAVDYAYDLGGAACVGCLGGAAEEGRAGAADPGRERHDGRGRQGPEQAARHADRPVRRRRRGGGGAGAG